MMGCTAHKVNIIRDMRATVLLRALTRKGVHSGEVNVSSLIENWKVKLRPINTHGFYVVPTHQDLKQARGTLGQTMTIGMIEVFLE